MYVLSRIDPRGQGTRLFVGTLLAIALFMQTAGTLLAGTTGNITGTIVVDTTGAPLAGVVVDAVAPTARYETKTDAKGFYSFNGVSPDTYAISFELTGYQPVSVTGVNVFADQTTQISEKLSKSLTTIGRVTASSGTGAFAKNQPQDTYTLSSGQIATQLGKTDYISETDLIKTLPGASIDSSGYPVIRGGRENEEGYQFEGIDYVDAFTNQFTNSLALNPSVGELQLTPGSGDATSGNTGTGSLNLISKKGTYPGFGSLDLEALGQPFSHQLGFEYGFATPNGRISNYFSFLGNDSDNQYGSWGTPAENISTGTFYAPMYQHSRSIVDNFILKFGKDNNQQFQIFLDNQQTNFTGTYGGTGGLYYSTNTPYNNYLISAYTGLSTAQQQQLIELLPYQPSATAPLGSRGAIGYYQPNNVLKFQYSNNLNSSTFVTAKFYEQSSVSTFDFPYDEASLGGGFYLLQGGHRDGGAIDLSDQINEHNLIQVGGRFDFLAPGYSYMNPTYGLLSASGFSNAYETADFVSPTDANCPLGPGACGYLYNYFGNPGTVPRFDEIAQTSRQDFATYLTDKISFNRLTANVGIRIDGTNYKFPSLNGCNPTSYANYISNNNCQYAPTGYRPDASDPTNPDGEELPYTTIPSSEKTPIIPEPRLAASYLIGANDQVRASYGRTVELASLADVDESIGNIYGKFKNVPSYENLLGPFDPTNPSATQAMFCGVLHNLPCTSYANQLYWENQDFNGIPIQPVKPETFNNYDFSYSHQFPDNVSIKVTPFYRRGYDATALVAQPLLDPITGKPVIVNGAVEYGPATQTNDGQERTTGIEFYVTKEAAYGLSGSFSATYINEFSNVIPLSASEDFFPSIPTQSIQLGNLYRVGFISPLSASLAVQYKTHSGWRLNPVVTYNHGYPIGQGNLTAAYVNGKPYNIPNTNVTSSSGPYYAPNYVDPQNPGTLYKPNIDATRGTPEGASAGGVLSNARFNTNVSLEYSPPGTKSTFGVQVLNLFNVLYDTEPSYNPYWQPVAKGIGGPTTGYNSTGYYFPGIGIASYLPNAYSNQPYNYIQGSTPLTFTLYYQLKL